jgi:hypothetical protein
MHSGHLMPLMRDVPHDECVVKDRRTSRKPNGVRKEAGGNVFNPEGTHTPLMSLQPQVIESMVIACYGVSE